jgi:carbonic anhydrase
MVSKRNSVTACSVEYAAASKEFMELHLSKKVKFMAMTICIFACLVPCGAAVSVSYSKYPDNDIIFEQERKLDDGTCNPTDTYDWTYNYACTAENDSQVAPDLWYTIYPDCAGSRQSPVNLALSDISLSCSEATVTGSFEFIAGSCSYSDLIPNAYEVVWEIGFDATACGTPPSIMVNDATYVLSKFHWHSYAEHTIGGGYYDGELHMVHINSNDSTDYIVLGVFLSVNSGFQDNTEMSDYLTLLVDEANSDRRMMDDDELVNPYDMLPADGTFFTYLGSLTIPSCAEVVTWIIFEQPVMISPNELATLRDGYAGTEYTLADSGGNNARPIQELGDRIIYRCPM